MSSKYQEKGKNAKKIVGEMQSNSSCNTFYNERKSDFVTWPLLPDREEQKQALTR